jgi:polysaccharide deacetylase 2 family uncharacterized protein YibQ
MPYILHFPLEPEGYPKVNPGTAAILVAMSPEEIERKFTENLPTVPGASGISNHMGSRFSADSAKMKALLTLVQHNKLFYFDSHTTPHSTAASVAGELGMPVAVNDLFLDDVDTREAIIKKLDALRSMANKHGTAIGIAHVQRKYIVEALRERISAFKADGIEFVYLTALTHKKKHS